MNIFSKLVSLSTLLFTTQIAFAQDVATQQQQPGLGQMLQSMLPMFAMVFLIFYLLVFKPQQKKIKDHETLMTSLKKGDAVVTSSGIIGRVAGVEKDHILVEITANVKVKFEKSHVVRKEEKEAATQNAA